MPIGREALDALRVEALCPWYGPDIGEDNLLHETGLVTAVHSSTKGCYVGQEVIARLEGRGGNVNKALRGLRLTAPAAAGAVVTAAGKDAGWVTTAAVSPAGPIAPATCTGATSRPAARWRWRALRRRSSPARRGAVKISHTKTGDSGTTGLLGGRACPGRSARPAYGDVDEANAVIGSATALAAGPLAKLLSGIQKDLFAIGARLADPTHAVATRRARPR